MESCGYSRCCKVRIKKVYPLIDLDPILDDSITDGQNLDVFCDMSEDEIATGYSRIENENDIDSDGEWEMSRGGFGAIQEMQDEFDGEEDKNCIACIFLHF